MTDAAALGDLLARRLGPVLGGRVTVDVPRRLTAGASRETWIVTATLDDVEHRLVLRRDPPGAPRPDRMALEAAVLAAAHGAGVPVPRLIDHDTDPDVLGAPFLITEFVAGETIPRRILRDDRFAQARAKAPLEVGAALARIHAVDPDTVSDLPAADPLERLRHAYAELGYPLAAVDLALPWLAEHRPEPVPDALVHGDFRLGNLMVDETGLRCVLDWEQAHRGDPREDLGFLCVKAWRFGAALPVGGLASLDDLLDAYAAVAGHRPDPAAVHWWQVWGTAWWAVGTQTMAQRHLSGRTPSVELAAIGRRTSEQEHDLLLALGVPPGPDEPPVPDDTPGLFGRPTAAELTAAVAGFLRDEVMPASNERLAFGARVAANALDVVVRELTIGPGLAARHPLPLKAVDAVRAAVTDRLRVDNPRYPAQPDAPFDPHD